MRRGSFMWGAMVPPRQRSPLNAWLVLFCLVLIPDVSAQVIGPNRGISGDSELENSPSITTMGNNIVAVWSRGNLGTAVSRDGGITWADSIIQPNSPEKVGGRTSACIDSRGTAFCAAFGLDAFLGRTIFLFSGALDQPTWRWQRRPNVLPFIPFDGPGLDGIRMVCDRSSDILCLVYTRGSTIQFTRSTDSGESWTGPIDLSGNECHTAQLALGPEGEVHVVWEDYVQGAIVGRKSTDQGASFGPPFTLGVIHDNVSFGPPGRQDLSRGPLLPNIVCMDFPAFLGMAVDVSESPRRGAVYGVWTDHAQGAANPDPVRTVFETEPNDGPGNATPIQIGDDFAGGFTGDPEQDNDLDLFTFEGTAGTTIQITGEATFCSPAVGCREIPYGFTLLCGDDPAALTQIGCGSVFGPSPIPPAIYTLPTTGRYYLDVGASTSYRFQLREYVVDPSSVARDHRDVVLVRSTDGGATWSDKVRVNDDAPIHDNAIPAVTVDGSGRVHVAWYDRREEPECGARVHTYWTYSEDGGVTFVPSRRVSEQPSEGGRRYYGPGQENSWQVGDHLALHAEGERVYVLWTQIPIGGGGDILGSVIGFGSPDPPEILEVEPLAGPPGTTVEIRGRNFSEVTGVFFHNTFASFTVVDDGLIRTEVPVNGRTGYVAAVNPPRVGVSPALFHVTPRVVSVLPSKGLAGQAVKILGANFTGALEVRFNGVPAGFTVVSDTLIAATVPMGASEGPIEVSGPGGSAASDPFLIGALASGVNLAWDDCGKHGARLKQFACDTNKGDPFTVIASFTPPLGVDRLIAITAEVRAVNPQGPLPDWWELATGGGCRSSNPIGWSFDFTTGPNSCRDIFGGEPQFRSLTYTVGYEGPENARLLISASLPPERVGPLDAAVEYYGFRLMVNRWQTTGFLSCAGCPAPVRLELRSIQLHQAAGMNYDPVLTEPLNGRLAYWQSAGPEVTSFLPRQGPMGAELGIRGSGFEGTTSVRLNDSEAAFTVASDSLLLATVPADATSGPIVVTDPYGAETSKQAFTVGPRLGAINLAWGDCGVYGGAVQRFACDANTGAPFDLVASFRPPPDVTHGFGLLATLTVRNPDGVLPDWWKHGSSGCRVAFSSNFDFTSGPFSCADLFQGQGLGGLTYLPGGPSGNDPNRAQIVVQGTVPAEMASALDPNVEYYAAILRVRRNNTVGDGACPGCGTPMCVSLDSVQLLQPPELGYNPVIDVPADNTTVAWQSLEPECGGGTSVQVSLVTAEASADQVRIIWEIPSDGSVGIDRRTAGGAWQRLARLIPDGRHRVEFVDRDVRPGATYSYRVGLTVDGAEVYAGETSLTVPNVVWAFALSGVRWRASGLEATISLPVDGPATFEVFDLSGRRRASQRYDGLDAGEHRVELRTTLRPGVYFGRLSQGSDSAARRFVVID
jgi:IPT/TIG domain